MIRSLRVLAAIVVLLLSRQFVHAGPTEDLWLALKQARYPDAITAIAAGANLSEPDPAFGSPLNFASCWADSDVVKALIAAKADVNFIAPLNGQGPLMNAASWGNADAVRLLLAAGADVKAKNKIGQTVLGIGVGSSKLSVIRLLVEAGADPKEVYQIAGAVNQTAMSALIAAYPPAEKVGKIVAIGGNLSKLGITFPPRLATPAEADFSPLGEMAAYLLSKGADPNEKNGGWGCILNQAISFGKLDIAKALIEGKADLATTTRLQGKVSGFEVTSLMLAASKGYDAIVEQLCKAGADVAFTSKEQATEVSGSASITYYTTTRKYNNAYSVALDNEHPNTAEILKKYGAVEPED